MIPYGRQSLSAEDIEAVVQVLKSDWITQGQMVPKFEQALANYVGAQYAVAVTNGTSALHIACLALGLGQNDYLWTSPISFVASANCALYCGAKIDFVDVASDYPVMSVSALAEKLSQAEKTGQLPKIVIPVHYAGQSCDMQAIHKLSKRYQFHIIEDACHALGGEYQQLKIGLCQYADIAVFSFHPVKSITTGEGGMATSNHSELTERMRMLRNHAITRDHKLMSANEGGWYYQQLGLGFNYRMTDFQAALGLSQLDRIDKFIHKRRAIAKRYDTLLKSADESYWSLLPQMPDCKSAYHLYPIRINNEVSKRNRLQVFQFMRDQNVGVSVHYIPIYKQPYYQRYQFTPCPNAENYYAETLSLPIYSDLREAEQVTVIDTFKQSFGNV